MWLGLQKSTMQVQKITDLLLMQNWMDILLQYDTMITIEDNISKNTTSVIAFTQLIFAGLVTNLMYDYTPAILWYLTMSYF